VILIDTSHTGQGGRKIGEGIALRHTSQRAEEERKRTELTTRDKILREEECDIPQYTRWWSEKGKRGCPQG